MWISQHEHTTKWELRSAARDRLQRAEEGVGRITRTRAGRKFGSEKKRNVIIVEVVGSHFEGRPWIESVT